MPKPPPVPEILPGDLVAAVESGRPMQVLDVRAPARVQTGRIDVVPDERFRNIVGSRLATITRGADTGLDPDIPVAVVCGHGNSSKPAALFLKQLGFDAQSLRGGMAAWMRLTVPRNLKPPSSLDALIQFDRVGKGALGYLLISDGEALVVDPPRNVEAYEKSAEVMGARITAVADTHAHADYISGATGLSARMRVPYYLHPADAVYPYDGTPGTIAFQPLEEGDTITFGRAAVRAVHTPGHTEGSLSLMIDDDAVLTGDFLFVDSVGRPDLAGKADQWVEDLVRSIARAKAEWPGEAMVYPAHYARDRERNADRTIGQRFGTLCSENEVLSMQDPAALTEWVLAKTTSAPASYPTIKAVNVGLRNVSEVEAEELEVGKNECAVGG